MSPYDTITNTTADPFLLAFQPPDARRPLKKKTREEREEGEGEGKVRVVE